jgi:hypothetical protein
MAFLARVVFSSVSPRDCAGSSADVLVRVKTLMARAARERRAAAERVAAAL